MMPEADLVATWHNQLACPGNLTLSDDRGWECSRDTECPMMQEVARLADES